MILGIGFEIADIVDAFKEGEVGEAVFRIGMLVVGIGLPIVIGILATGVLPGLIAMLIVAAAALAWEFLVPDDVKQQVYDWIEGLFTEIGQVFGELFSIEGEGFFGKALSLFVKLFSLPLTYIRLWLSLFLSEGLKRTINEGVRNLADSLVNGIIRFINGLIQSITENIPSWIPGADKARNFQIGEVDFSNLNLMMGTDASVGGFTGSEWASRDLQMTSMLQ